jgi:probable rRNA maturation factor
MIDIAIIQHYEIPALDTERLRRLILSVCRDFDVTEGTVSLAVLDDAEMIRLNRQYKQLDRTTDCFSFDLSDAPDTHTPRSYEILVNGEKAGREAKARGHGVDAELALYIVHGLLHNLGFDDQNSAAAAEIHAREDEILQRSGYGVVYYKADARG